MNPNQKIITIPGENFSYPIKYGEANGQHVKKIIDILGFSKRRIALITDSNVKKLKITGALIEGLGLQNNQIFVFSAGEPSKNRDTYNFLQDGLLEKRYGRDSLVIALGGGVVGDMAGYVADTHNRGVPLIQIPTTVLSQADSSIGGKVGIDVGNLKNAIGAFKQPNAVIVDVGWLNTLTDEHYRNGMAETVKHGVLGDKDFFDWLVDNVSDIATRNLNNERETYIAQKNCKIKGNVVMQDPEEQGRRKTLNYGHTVGHAVESASNYTLPHGYCVAIGMQVAGRVATLLKTGFTNCDLDNQEKLLKKLGLPTTIPEGQNIEELIQIMIGDKKNIRGEIRFTLPKHIGGMSDFGGEWVTSVNKEVIMEAMQ
ncbi:3-dehydroquinate synthase [Candidatus Gracilibacteria bacterium]|nr:3-dehydroquinate synthase [Candidatus Gracilibacteria bacterium]NUJ98891.1 3-dehydroquinate synthase [Candidatus Gracilibacteria bacterium]